MFKIGYGADFHRFEKNRKLILGGLEIPYSIGLAGHSDADVVVHSICDAILGALGLGDIGEHFPDSDDKYKDISSLKLLDEVKKKMNGQNFQIGNLDITILMENPKIGKYKKQMCEILASTLDCNSELINVKATTTEKMGFIGEGVGVESRAIVLLKKKD